MTSLDELIRAGTVPRHARVVEAHGGTWAEWPNPGGGVTRHALEGGEWRTAAVVPGGAMIRPPSSSAKPKPSKRRMKGAVEVRTVNVTATAWATVEAAPLSRSVEIAGLFWGRRNGSTIKIEHAHELGVDATPTSVKLDAAAAKSENARQVRQGREIVGMWHTHPSAQGWTNHSDADLKMMREFSRKADGDAFVSIILSRQEPRLAGMKSKGWAKPDTTVVVTRYDRDGAIRADFPALEIEAGWKL